MGLDQPYQPNDPWELEGSFNHSTARDLAITSDARKGSVAKAVAKIPLVLSGMDKAEALAFVSRLFDAAQAGAVLWGDELLLKRFLEQCSRTGSQETIDGCARELRHFVRWRDQHPLTQHSPLLSSGSGSCCTYLRRSAVTEPDSGDGKK